MNGSLPGCARAHPGVPSDIRISLCRRGGKDFERRACFVCKSRASKSLHSDRRRDAALNGAATPIARADYGGIYHFGWTPPEMLVEQLNVEIQICP